MYRTLALFAAVLLLAGCGRQEAKIAPKDEAPAETLTAPMLSGPDVTIPVAEADKIKALGWAMMLDRDTGTREWERTSRYFQEACERDPNLKREVADKLETKAMIAAAKRAHQRRLR